MRVGAACVLVASVLAAPLSRAGSLDPTGPPAPTMKTLDQVEPRIPVESLPGNAQFLHVISQPGSYYVSTGVFLNPGLGAIQITAFGPVTLDLKGFSLMSGRWGGENGIVVSTNAQPLVIRNGILSGWDGAAISAPTTMNATFENLQIYNGVTGIDAGARSVVRHVLVNGCATGIIAGVGTAVLDSVADHDAVGIRIDQNGRVEGCTVYAGSNDGILVGAGGVVLGNHVSDSNGIRVTGNNNTIDGNACYNVGTCVKVSAGTGNLVIRNKSELCATDYLVGTGNKVGTITADPTTATPWANFAID